MSDEPIPATIPGEFATSASDTLIDIGFGTLVRAGLIAAIVACVDDAKRPYVSNEDNLNGEESVRFLVQLTTEDRYASSLTARELNHRLRKARLTVI